MKPPEKGAKERIKDRILKMEQLVLEARTSTDILTSLWAGRWFEDDRVTMGNEFLRYNIYLNSRAAILALSKLFPHNTHSGNNKFSFRKLINKIREERLLTPDKLKPYEKALEELETKLEKAGKPITEILQFWRDKQIAHTDEVTPEQLTQLRISIQQYQELVNLAFSILQTINKELGNPKLSFVVYGNIVNDLDELIGAIADKRRLEKRKNK